MKIKRFTATSMREAIRLVREEQGPDAVILSNRRVPEGIEVVSATDYDAALIQQALRNETRTDTVIAQPVAAPAVAAIPAPAAPAQRLAPTLPVIPVPPTLRATPETLAPARPAAVPAPLPVPAAEDRQYQELRNELLSMRGMLEGQLASRTREAAAPAPQRSAVLRSLMDLALAPSLARELIAELPAEASDEQARYLQLGALARRIPAHTDDVLMNGGVFALVGATGVGKTTTVAKLAARFISRHGNRSLALVSTDHYRIGAREQLDTYGRLMGVPVHAADTPERLLEVLRQLAGCRLVLIDTAGMSPRDHKLNAQLASLARAGNVRNYLVLPASSQAGDLDEAARRFGATPLAGCIVTKLDEATRLGGVLSTAIRRQLPIAYFCDGQRVPEDLHLARPYHLAVRAQQLAQQIPASVDDDALSLQFGAANVAA